MIEDDDPPMWVKWVVYAAFGVIRLALSYAYCRILEQRQVPMTIEEFLTEPGSWEMYPGSARAAKPRLRWRHCEPWHGWSVKAGSVGTIGVDYALRQRIKESALAEFACNPDPTKSWRTEDFEPLPCNT